MLTKFICTILLFILSIPVFSQTNSDGSYLTLSYSFGLTGRLTPERSVYGSQSGTTSSVEISNIPRNNIGFFLNFMSTSYDLDNYYYSGNGNEGILLKNHGLIGGVRIFTSNKNIFFDEGIGYYNIESTPRGGGLGWGSYGDNASVKTFGITFGMGARFKVGNSLAIVLKGKFNNAFLANTPQGFYQELIFNAGIEMSNNAKSSFQFQQPGKFLTGIILGNTGMANDKLIGSYGAEFSFGVANNFSLVANYIHKSSDKTYYGFDDSFESWENNYGGGIRNYFGRNNLKPFFECLANLNVRKENTNDISDDNTLVINSIGLVLGTGAEFDLSDRVTGILKGNYTFFDNADNAAGMFGGLKYRF